MQVVDKPAVDAPPDSALAEATPLPILLRIPEWTAPAADLVLLNGQRKYRAGMLTGVVLAAAATLWLARWQGWVGSGTRPRAAPGPISEEIESMPMLPRTRLAAPAGQVAAPSPVRPEASQISPARLVPTIVPVEGGGTP